MKRYKNLHGDSGVMAYELGDDYILVEFRNGMVYKYSHSRAGKYHVDVMKAMATAGEGLSGYISQHVWELYD